MLIGRTREIDAAELAHGALGAVAAGDPGGLDLDGAAVRALQRGHDVFGMLREGDELRPPLYVQPVLAQLVAQDALVFVLTEHQHKRERANVLADVANRDAGGPTPVRPEVGALAARAARERLLSEAHLGVNLECPRVYRHGAGLLCRSGMAVDDHCPRTTARKLVGQHQACRAGPTIKTSTFIAASMVRVVVLSSPICPSGELPPFVPHAATAS